eukprot:gene5267-8885_t
MSRNWVDVQRKTFLSWVKIQLKETGESVSTIEDFKSGEITALLVTVLTTIEPKNKIKKNANGRIFQIQNNKIALDILKEIGMTNLASAEDIVNQNEKLILGFLWRLILKFQIAKFNEKKAQKRLEQQKKAEEAAKIQAEKDALEKQKQQENQGETTEIIKETPKEEPKKEEPKKPVPKPKNEESNVKKELLGWVKTISKEDGDVKDFTNAFQDGTLLRGIVHNMQRKSPEQLTEIIKGKTALELNTEAIDIADKEFGIPALVDADDVTSNPEELSMMTYLSYFREYEFEHPSLMPDSSTSEILLFDDLVEKDGYCLKENPIMEDEKFSFKIEAKDVNGGSIKEFEDFEVFLKSGDEIIPCYSTLDLEGLSMGIVSTKAGDYEAHVQIDGKDIKRSPFSIKVQAKTSGITSVSVEGQGVKNGIKAEKETSFDVILKNKEGENLGTLDDAKIIISGPGEITPAFTVLKEGNIHVDYTPPIGGDYKVMVQVDGKDLFLRDFTVVNKSIPEKCTVNDFPETAETGAFSTFTIVPRDKDGNQVLVHDLSIDELDQNEFKVDIIAKEEMEHEITLNKDGTYSVKFKPKKKAGKFMIGVSKDEKDIIGSPFECIAISGADAEKSTITGETSFEAGVEAKLLISAKDKNDESRPSDSDEFLVLITGTKDIEAIKLKPIEEGKYELLFTPEEKGSYLVTATLDDKDIKHSPLMISIHSGFDSSKSTIETLSDTCLVNEETSFIVAARDVDGDLMIIKNEKFTIIDSKGESIPFTLKEYENRTKEIFFTPKNFGVVKIDSNINGADLESKSILAIPSVDASKSKLISPEKGRIDLKNTFVIAGKDLNDQPISKGDYPTLFDIDIDGPSENVPVEVSQDENGEYLVQYSPDIAGQYLIGVSYNGEEIDGSPSVVDIGGALDLEKTEVSGTGVKPNVKPGYEHEFKILPKDKEGIKIKLRDYLTDSQKPGDELSVIISAPKDKTVPAEIEYNPKGEYVIFYKPNDIGEHQIKIMFDKDEKKCIDKTVQVEQVPDQTKSSVKRFDDSPNANERCEFLIQVLDDEGYPYTSLNDFNDDSNQKKEFDIKIKGKDGELPFEFLPFKEGQYMVSYVPEKGVYDVEIKIRDIEIKDSPLQFQAFGADPMSSKIRGSGIEEGVVKEKSVFSIIPKDRDGKKRSHSDDFVVQILDVNNKEIEAKLENQSNGETKVSYVPEVSGEHTIIVKLDDVELKDSPITVDIENVVDPKKCSVEILDDYQTSDVKFKVYIVGADGVKLPKQKKRMKLLVKGGDGYLSQKIEEMNAEYLCRFQAPKKSKYIVKCLIDDSEIFSKIIKVSNLDADPTKSILKGVTSGINIDQNKTPKVEILVQARDSNNEPITKGGTKFEPKVVDSDFNEIKHELIDNENGTYKLVFEPDHPSIYTTTVQINDVDVINSPNIVNVTGDVDATQSYIEGPGLKKCYDKVPATFKIITKDKNGIPCKIGGEDFDVEVIDTTKEGTIGTILVDDEDNGEYTVMFIPQRIGFHKIEVKYKDKHLSKSPTLVVARPTDAAPVAKNSIVTTTPAFVNKSSVFHITLQDRANKPITSANDWVTAKGEVPCSVVDNHNGKYSVIFTPKKVGPLKFIAKVGGLTVPPKPIVVDVQDAPKDTSGSIVGMGMIIFAENKKESDFQVNITKVSTGEIQDENDIENEPSVELRPIISKTSDDHLNISINAVKFDQTQYKFQVKYNSKEISGTPFIQSL